MPKSTPLQKVEAVRFFGKQKVRIYLLGANYDEAFSASRKFCETNGAIYISPFDRFVDGASVKQVGLKTFAICAKGLSRMLTVSKKNLCQTMLDLYALMSMIVEPAGALSVAGLAEMAEEIKGKTVVCVISGGNFDPKRFPEIKLLTSA